MTEPQYDWNQRRTRKQPDPAATIQPTPAANGNGYGAAALAGELQTLLDTGEGGRNHQLNISAFNLGQLVTSGHLDEHTVRDQLHAAALQIGLELGETRATINSGLGDGMKLGRNVALHTNHQVDDVTGLLPENQAQPATSEAPGDGLPEEAALRVHQFAVAQELHKLRIRADARRLYDDECRPPMPAFDSGTLGEILARPPAPPNRVEDLIPWEAGTLLTAQRKTGKTTMVLNLLQSLLTGEDFLGRFSVEPIDGTVAFLNYEVSAAQIGRWADEVGLDHDRMFIVNLRGRRNPLAHDDDRQALAETLRGRGTETVVYDPFGRAYFGASQNDAGEVGAWLSQLDQFTRANVGARDLILTAHAGWDGERTRGSTALEDWADVIINLTRDNNDDTDNGRYFRAFGRDVEIDEDQLQFDMLTRRLTLASTGSRKNTRQRKHSEQLQDAVLKIVQDNPGINGTQVERKLREDEIPFQRGEHRRALQTLTDLRAISAVTVARGAKSYRVDVAQTRDFAVMINSRPSPSNIGLGQTPVTRGNTPGSPGSPDLAHGLGGDLAQPAPIYGGGLGHLAKSGHVDKQPGFDMPPDHSSCNHCGQTTPDREIDDNAGYCHQCARLWGNP